MVQQPGKGDDSQRFLRSLLGNLTGMVYRCRNNRDWTMEFVSRGCRELTGYAADELIGNRKVSYSELIHPEDQELVWQKVQQAVQRKRRFQLTYRIVTQSGEEKWVQEEGLAIQSSEGDIEALEGYIFDVTEQKKGEQSEREYSDLIKHIPLGLIIYEFEDTSDDRSLRLTSINPAACQVIGISAKESHGKFIDELFPALRAKGIPQLFAEVARSGKPRELEHFEYADENLETATWTFKAFPLPGDRVAVAFEDITDKKRLEEQFLQAQKMEVVGTLAGGVAHDFNNILTGIGGYAQLLLDQMNPQSEAFQDLSEIQALVYRATGLTRQLLLFARRQPADRVVANLGEVVDDSLKMLRRLVGENIDFQFHAALDLANVEVDVGQIEQVLMNLVVNARDAMPNGGSLIIETKNVDLDEPYALTYFKVKTGAYVMVSVSDTGQGMNRKIQKQIFEPFFTTKEKGKGTGLGLSTVYSIVKQHDGHIWVYSEPGQGTTFKMYLPRVDRSQTELEEKTAKQSAPGGGSGTILLVEDEATLKTLIERILRGLGYEVLSAANPQEAETIFEARGNEITLLLTDVVMPGASGPKLYERLSKKRDNLKVMFMSGYTDTAVRKGNLPDGAGFIQKPFSPTKLATRIREILDR